MFIGHFAVGFAAKRAAPKTSLGLLLGAPVLLDLLWPIFLLLGWEEVRIVINRWRIALRFRFSFGCLNQCKAALRVLLLGQSLDEQAAQMA
jgi:hypothetical protein